MKTADMSPRARWARKQVEPWLAEQPEGLLQPLTQGLQHLDDLGILLDPERAGEVRAAARAESAVELAELQARLSAKEAENAELRRELRSERKAGDAFWGELLPEQAARRPGVDVAAASQSVAGLIKTWGNHA